MSAELFKQEFTEWLDGPTGAVCANPYTLPPSKHSEHEKAFRTRLELAYLAGVQMVLKQVEVVYGAKAG